MKRTLYLVAYDIRESRRLLRVHRWVRGWAIRGQKSAYECWLSASERARLESGVRPWLQPQDRWLTVRLRVAEPLLEMGSQRPDMDGFFLFIGEDTADF